MNAMALKKTDELIDYFGGREDIEKKLIRAVGDPNLRFQEDALRMLRAIRFSAQLDFSLHPLTLKAIQEKHHLIKHVSMERVKVELEKIWKSNHVEKGMKLLVTSKLTLSFQGDWESSLEKWNGFLMFQNVANGWAFFALTQQSTDINTLLSYYKCSNAEKSYVKQVLLAVEKLKIGPWNTYDLFQFKAEVLRAAAHYADTILDVQLPYSIEQMYQMKDAIPISSARDIVINGNELMEWKKEKRGPWIKEALEKLTREIVNGQVLNEREHIKQWFFREYDI